MLLMHFNKKYFLIYFLIALFPHTHVGRRVLRISESINRRRTDNTMAKRTKRQPRIYKIPHRKLKIEQHVPH